MKINETQLRQIIRESLMELVDGGEEKTIVCTPEETENIIYLIDIHDIVDESDEGGDDVEMDLSENFNLRGVNGIINGIIKYHTDIYTRTMGNTDHRGISYDEYYTEGTAKPTGTDLYFTTDDNDEYKLVMNAGVMNNIELGL